MPVRALLLFSKFDVLRLFVAYLNVDHYLKGKKAWNNFNMKWQHFSLKESACGLVEQYLKHIKPLK